MAKGHQNEFQNGHALFVLFAFLASLDVSWPRMGPGTRFGTIFHQTLMIFCRFRHIFYHFPTPSWKRFPRWTGPGEVHVETTSSAPGAVHRGNHFRPALCCANFLPHFVPSYAFLWKWFPRWTPPAIGERLTATLFKPRWPAVCGWGAAMIRRRRLQYIYISVPGCGAWVYAFLYFLIFLMIS